VGAGIALSKDAGRFAKHRFVRSRRGDLVIKPGCIGEPTLESCVERSALQGGRRLRYA